jgi:hypothetical protein
MAAATTSVLLATSSASAEGESTPKPDLINADEVRHRPSGYREETRARRGAIIAGGIMTGVGGLMILAGVSAKRESSGMGNGPGSGGELLYIPGTVVTAVGLPLLIYGLVSARTVYVREDTPQLSLVLSPRRDAGAVALTCAF